MLVLTRKREQRILLDGGIVVSVEDISGDRVKLGFICPKNVRIVREELLTDEQRLAMAAKGKGGRHDGPAG
jgi:carbon storage regulator